MELGLHQMPRLARLLLDIASGMLHLHSQTPNPIIHRDIRCANILLHADGSHLSQVRSVATRPISEELFAAQAFVLAMDGIHARTCAVTACPFDFAISPKCLSRTTTERGGVGL